jgi:hypothetical protein
MDWVHDPDPGFGSGVSLSAALPGLAGLAIEPWLLGRPPRCRPRYRAGACGSELGLPYAVRMAGEWDLRVRTCSMSTRPGLRRTLAFAPPARTALHHHPRVDDLPCSLVT